MRNLDIEPPFRITECLEVTKSGDIPAESRGEQQLGQIFPNPPFTVLSRPWPNRRPKISRLVSLGRRGRLR